MKFTLSWLKEHLDTDESVEKLADKLTMIGLEVESLEDKAKLLAPFTIARVISAEQHPNADRLRVCMVDTGDGAAPVSIGVGVPAYPNPATGGLMKSIPNAPPLTGGSLRDEFTARFGLPTVIGNDGVCATEGEMVWGAGRPFQRFAVLTLGTGIGGAVVIDRKMSASRSD